MRVTSPSAVGVLYLSFNQDYTCIAIADYKGIKIYTIEPNRICYSSEIGAVR
jgi:autophagy-related protein 18